jgi:hypothetical protein
MGGVPAAESFCRVACILATRAAASRSRRIASIEPVSSKPSAAASLARASEIVIWTVVVGGSFVDTPGSYAENEADWIHRRPGPAEMIQIAAEVDRRRKAGEGFGRLARETKVSRGTVLRAYDFANRDEAAAAAREGRKPTRPPYTWSEESRAAKRKPRGA